MIESLSGSGAVEGGQVAFSLAGVVGLWNMNLRAYHAVMRLSCDRKSAEVPVRILCRGQTGVKIRAAVRFLFRRLK